MTPNEYTTEATSDPRLDAAWSKLQELLASAVTEHRHGEIGVMFKLVDGRIAFIKHTMEFTTK